MLESLEEVFPQSWEAGAWLLSGGPGSKGRSLFSRPLGRAPGRLHLVLVPLPGPQRQGGLGNLYSRTFPGTSLYFPHLTLWLAHRSSGMRPFWGGAGSGVWGFLILGHSCCRSVGPLAPQKGRWKYAFRVSEQHYPLGVLCLSDAPTGGSP